MATVKDQVIEMIRNLHRNLSIRAESLIGAWAVRETDRAGSSENVPDTFFGVSRHHACTLTH